MRLLIVYTFLCVTLLTAVVSFGILMVTRPASAPSPVLVPQNPE